MSELDEAKLLEIAGELEETLGDMSASDADKVVEEQIIKIYELLGYKIVKRGKKKTGFLGCVLLRKEAM